VIGIAASLAQLGRDAEAAFVFGAAEQSATVVELDVMNMLAVSGVTAGLDAAKQRLGNDAWRREVARGSELGVEQTIEVALRLSSQGAPAVQSARRRD
jgi:hypothetical protein